MGDGCTVANAPVPGLNEHTRIPPPMRVSPHGNILSKTPDQKVALAIATLAAFFIPFMGSSVNIALPTIGEEFGMDAVSLSWVATSFLLAAAMFLLPFGRLADIHGRKRFFAWGIAIYTLASLLSAVAPSGLALILFRGLQGLGGAMIFSTGIAILTSVYPQEERGKVLGFSVGSVYLGLSFGPSIGGFLTEQFGWRSVFMVHVPIGLLIVSLIAAKLKGEWADARGERFDWVGSLIYTSSLMGVVYGLSLLPQALGGWLALSGAAGLILFVGWELKTDSPLMNIKLFRTSTVFAYSNLAALIHYSATFAVGFLLSLYLQYIQGYGAQNAGLILIAQPVVMAAFSPYAGKLSDRIEPRRVASIGMALTALGLFLLVLIDSRTGVGMIVGNLIILGLGFALFSSPNTNAVMSSVDKRYFGVASGTLGTMRLTGQMLSMGIATLIFAVYIGRVQITPEQYPLFLKSTQVAFLVFGLLCLAGILASLARGRLREVEPPIEESVRRKGL